MRPKHQVQRIAAERRRERVSELLAQRLPYREIAAELEVSVSCIWKDTVKIREAWRERSAFNVNEEIERDLRLLDAVIRGLAPDATRGDFKSVIALVKVLERRAKLLGLDAAAEVHLTARPAHDHEVDLNDVRKTVREFIKDPTGFGLLPEPEQVEKTPVLPSDERTH